MQSHSEDVADICTGHRARYDDLAADASATVGVTNTLASLGGLNEETCASPDGPSGEAAVDGDGWKENEQEQPVVNALAAAGIDVAATDENCEALAAVRAVGLGPEETVRQMLAMLEREPSLRRWLTNGGVCHLLHDVAVTDWVTDVHRASGLRRDSEALERWHEERQAS